MGAVGLPHGFALGPDRREAAGHHRRPSAHGSQSHGHRRADSLFRFLGRTWLACVGPFALRVFSVRSAGGLGRKTSLELPFGYLATSENEGADLRHLGAALGLSRSSVGSRLGRQRGPRSRLRARERPGFRGFSDVVANSSLFRREIASEGRDFLCILPS